VIGQIPSETEAVIPPRTSTAGSASGTTPIAAGTESAARILRGAVRLFIREGGAAFSARGVAKELGVSLGAVQHSFRTKDQLLAAMIEQVLADYAQKFQELDQSLPFNGEARLLKAIDFLVADTWRPESRRFFFNLFALSCHNSFAARRMSEVYAHHRRRIASYIGAARPNFSEGKCFDLALQVAALIEGLMVYTAPGAKSVPSREHLADMIRATVLRLISDPEGSRSESRRPAS
jgi:AcrR family transcriptional regulator